MSPGAIDEAAVHPLESLVVGLEALTATSGAELAWTLTPAQLADLLPRLAVVENQLAGARLAMLREADRHQVGDPVGFASTAGWFADATRTTKRLAHGQVALATELDRDEHETVRAATLSGAVSTGQAAVIVRAVDELPDDLVDRFTRKGAEQMLVGFAEDHDPRELRILGRRVLEYLAPDLAEEAERRALEAEERQAAASSSFRMRPDGHGSMIGSFKVPVLAGEMLAKHLNAIAAPRHQNATGEGFQPTVARPLRLGQAFVEYLETRNAQGMPRAGGVPASIVVTMTRESLEGGAGAATLDSGERISASEARRLACEAGVIPAVLGTRSQVLDLGRRSRFHTEAQRIAITVRDKGCREEHCDHPPSMCHVHHPQPWSEGGGTTVENGILLCPRAHALAHDSRYTMVLLPNGRIRFRRRA